MDAGAARVFYESAVLRSDDGMVQRMSVRMTMVLIAVALAAPPWLIMSSQEFPLVAEVFDSLSYMNGYLVINYMVHWWVMLWADRV